MTIKLHLRDLSPLLVEAWRREFAGEALVTVSCGDIFSERAGPVAANDPIDVRADAVVSPANSFGFMDGGIDAVYTHVLGSQVQEAVQAAIAERHAGELPVGQALIVPTGRPEIPWCVCAPTMRAPGNVADSAHAYLAMRAALLAAIAHGGIASLLCPGLGTAVGAMPVDRCARQMAVAWRRVVRGEDFRPSTIRSAIADDVALRR
jgi:O-acetyl-ADP-ribose deacetylase (regulator of RNase III)